MCNCSILIDDAVAVASPVLKRMRIDGHDRAPLPFAERHVQSWRLGKPQPNMDLKDLIHVLKVRCKLLQRPTCAPSQRAPGKHGLA